MRNLIFAFAFIVTATPTMAQEASQVEATLTRLAQDYEGDPMAAAPIMFGVRVDNQTWTISTQPATPHGVVARVVAGPPSQPTFVFATNGETLARIGAGQLGAATALGQARSSDPTPMTVDTMQGFAPDAQFRERLFSVIMHFFTPGEPEITQFDIAHARLVHGAYTVPLHYGDGLRSAWYSIVRGQHVNADPRDQTNEFHSIFVITRGRGRARIGGHDMTLSQGQSVFVPAGVRHEFWNDTNRPLEFVLMMVGPGA